MKSTDAVAKRQNLFLSEAQPRARKRHPLFDAMLQHSNVGQERRCVAELPRGAGMRSKTCVIEAEGALHRPALLKARQKCFGDALQTISETLQEEFPCGSCPPD